MVNWQMTLLPASINDYAVLQNMARFYAYDMSRYCGQVLAGWEFPANGLYECSDLKKYLEDPDRKAFLIKIDDELAGFVLINKLEIMPIVDWNMGEFFIVAKFQRSGVGSKIARQVFDQFPGEWSVGAIPQNTRALNFWRQIIAEYTHGQFQEVVKTSEELKTAEHPDPYPMIILRFKTPQESQTSAVIQHTSIMLREPTLHDEKAFLRLTQQSQSFHQPWVNAPLNSTEFHEYIERYQQVTHQSFLVCLPDSSIVGVFNLSEIVYGSFQSAYLGFYVFRDYAGKGWMSAGLKMLLNKAFVDLKLHRLEANIQPQNANSLFLVQHNGFKKEGFSERYLQIDSVWRDHERWAITKEDWEKRNNEGLI